MISDPSTRRTLSILQSAFSGLGLLFLTGTALLVVLVDWLGKSGRPAASHSTLLLAQDLACLALVLAPSAVFALSRLIRHRPLPSGKPASWRWASAILCWPLLVLWADRLLGQGQGMVLAFGAVRFLAGGLLVAWIILVASHQLHPLGKQLGWGLFSAGLMGGTLLSWFLELLLLAAGAIFLGLVIQNHPASADGLNRLLLRLSTSGGSLRALQRILLPYLGEIRVLIPLLVGVSIVVPLIEEAAKPVGLWLLSRHGLSSAQGFTGGVICGGGFALVENLISSPPVLGSSWLVVSCFRFGTTLVHMLASGLVGWGLVSSWNSGHVKRLAWDYALAVTLHGSWNAAAVLLAVDRLHGGGLSAWGILLTGFLAGLAILSLALILGLNRKLHKSEGASG